MLISTAQMRQVIHGMPGLPAIILSVMLAFSIPPAVAADLKQAQAKAEQAYKEGRYREAVAILRPLEQDYAGEVEFDYLLGRTALEARELNLAIAALSRAITVDPSLVAARIQLARAYYNKGVIEHSRGAFEQARAEFENVLEQDPPRHIRQSIQDYIDVIDKYLEVRHINAHVYAELTTGFDTNIQSSPSRTYFTFYDQVSASTYTVKLDEAGRRRESSLGSVRAGAQVTLPLFSRYFDLFAAAHTSSTTYPSAHELDHNTFASQIGAHHYGDTNKKTFSLNFNELSLDDKRYADEFYVDIEWAQRINEANQLSLRLVGGDINYEDEQHAKSVNGGRLGIEWTHLPASETNLSEQIMLVTGRDDAQQCQDNCNNHAPFRRDIAGLRLGLGADVFSQSRLYTSLYLEASDYDEPFFSRKRDDLRYELFLGMNTRLSEQWQLRPELHVIYNDSTIEVYEYRRTITTINIRWGF